MRINERAAGGKPAAGDRTQSRTFYGSIVHPTPIPVNCDLIRATRIVRVLAYAIRPLDARFADDLSRAGLLAQARAFGIEV